MILFLQVVMRFGNLWLRVTTMHLVWRVFSIWDRRLGNEIPIIVVSDGIAAAVRRSLMRLRSGGTRSRAGYAPRQLGPLAFVKSFRG